MRVDQPLLEPVNRHLLVKYISKKQDLEDDVGILLPEDYTPKEDAYVSVQVIDVARDCNEIYSGLRWNSDNKNRTAIVDRSMIEEVSHSGSTYHLILENYVVGLLRAP